MGHKSPEDRCKRWLSVMVKRWLSVIIQSRLCIIIQSWLSMMICNNKWHGTGLESRANRCESWRPLWRKVGILLWYKVDYLWQFIATHGIAWGWKYKQLLQNAGHSLWWEVDCLLWYKVDYLWLSTLTNGWGVGLELRTNRCETLRMCHDDKLTICYDTKWTLYEYLGWSRAGREAGIISRPLWKLATYYDTKLTICMNIYDDKR